MTHCGRSSLFTSMHAKPKSKYLSSYFLYLGLRAPNVASGSLFSEELDAHVSLFSPLVFTVDDKNRFMIETTKTEVNQRKSLFAYTTLAIPVLISVALLNKQTVMVA